jgi:hypothetical protein
MHVRTFCVSTSECTRVLSGHASGIRAVSMKSGVLATVSDCAVRVWNGLAKAEEHSHAPKHATNDATNDATNITTDATRQPAAQGQGMDPDEPYASAPPYGQLDDATLEAISRHPPPQAGCSTLLYHDPCNAMTRNPDMVDNPVNGQPNRTGRPFVTGITVSGTGGLVAALIHGGDGPGTVVTWVVAPFESSWSDYAVAYARDCTAAIQDADLDKVATACVSALEGVHNDNLIVLLLEFVGSLFMTACAFVLWSGGLMWILVPACAVAIFVALLLLSLGLSAWRAAAARWNQFAVWVTTPIDEYSG